MLIFDNCSPPSPYLFYERNAERVQEVSYAKGLIDPLEMQQRVKDMKDSHSDAKPLDMAQNIVQNDHNY